MTTFFLRSIRHLQRGLLGLVAGSALLLSGCASVSLRDGTTDGSTDQRAGTSSLFSTEGRLRMSPLFPSEGLQPIQPGSAYSLNVTSLTPPDDIWDRIRRGFAMPDLEGELVRDRTQWYSSRPEALFNMAERSRKYLFHVVEELERRGMPTELALLPYVESAFNPHAVSSAKAAGMWQFMPATGKDFDLKQNMFRDDRRDVLASTRAALDYLQKLHAMFDDWHLALAAYNWGQGSVKRAIERNQKKGLPTGYEDLTMPMETRMYVPKLQAIKNIVATPAAYNARLPLIENHPFFDTVTLERDIDVALAARLAEVDEDDFRLLNPSSRGTVIFAAGTPTILLPWNNAITFKRNLQFHIGPMATLTAWAVPSNMRTADIARRFDMPEHDLRSLNKIPPGMLVKAGSTILVPRMGHTQTEVPEHVADNGQLALQAEKVLRRSTVKARKGETLQSLAKRLKHDINDLAKWNNLPASAALKAGQAMVVFTEVSVAAAPRKGSHATPAAPAAKKKAVSPPPTRKQAPPPPAKSTGKSKK
ncbi:MAG TPA: transglycosylase SLT domain-containing protein [Burkholderiaceae bacterium]|nr:transglycosylase SLT domain-containing protein [Burkholderiaceae bacterium]